MPGDRIPYVTTNPTVVLLLLQLFGLRSQSDETKLLPCLIGCHDDTPLELRYGCTISLEKAHFVYLYLLFNLYRMNLPTVWELCSNVTDDVLWNHTKWIQSVELLMEWWMLMLRIRSRYEYSMKSHNQQSSTLLL